MKQAEINKDILRRILKDNSGTAYGRQYSFDTIESESEYQSRLPLTRYEDYTGLDEPGRYTAYPIYGKLLTSGSTGAKKVFPVTTEALKHYGSKCLSIPYEFFGGEEGPHLHISVFRTGNRDELIMSSVHFSAMRDNGSLDPASYVGGEKLLFSDMITDVPYVKTWLLLSEPGIVSIQSIFLYDMLLIMRYLEDNWRSILDDMKARRVTAELPDAVKEELIKLIPGDDVIKRAEDILSEGFDTPIVPRLLDKIRFVNGIGGSTEFEAGMIARYIGDTPTFSFAYGSTECYIGEAVHPGAPEYEFTDAAYFEFIHDGETVTDMSRLWIGGVYEPVVTTFSGLYRYRTQDLIRVTDFNEEGAPRFVVEGRERTLNIAGEKLGEPMAKKVLDEWSRSLEVTLHDYAVGIVNGAPGHYVIFVETEDDALPDDAEDILDDILCELSFDYDDVRNLKMLGKAQVIPCGRGRIAQSVTGGGHIKQNIFLNDEQVKALLAEDPAAPDNAHAAD